LHIISRISELKVKKKQQNKIVFNAF